MIFYRRYRDYLRLYWRAYHRLIIAIFFFILGLAGLANNLLSGVADAKRLLFAFASLFSMSVSGYFIHLDLRKLSNERFDLRIDEDDENFYRNASPLTVDEGTLERINDYLVWSDRTVNQSLNSAKTRLRIREPKYEVPLPLRNFMAKAVNKRKPTWDESKIGLRSDINLRNLTSGRIEIQETTYFSGISTNEIARCRVDLINREQNRAERICSLFDYVSEAGSLIPLSKSILSNHIGVTTLLVTQDPCIALQLQGDTQVDKTKINAGASGSADWQDLALCPDAVGAAEENPKALQNLVCYAMEREAHEELSAKTGDGFSKTTITGYARYVHRGGKPEFFGITFLNQDYSDLKIRRQERKWVLKSEPRTVTGHSKPALIEAIASLEKEFDPNKTQAASISMIICLRFAREYLERSDVRLEDLAPAGYFVGKNLISA